MGRQGFGPGESEVDRVMGQNHDCDENDEFDSEPWKRFTPGRRHGVSLWSRGHAESLVCRVQPVPRRFGSGKEDFSGKIFAVSHEEFSRKFFESIRKIFWKIFLSKRYGCLPDRR
jgi:hypothetical protein